MKYGYKLLIAGVAVAALAYLVDSFILFDLDASRWSNDVRAATVLLFFVIFMITAFIMGPPEDEEEPVRRVGILNSEEDIITRIELKRISDNVDSAYRAVMKQDGILDPEVKRKIMQSLGSCDMSIRIILNTYENAK